MEDGREFAESSYEFAGKAHYPGPFEGVDEATAQ
jgi:hypothetical protein